MLPPTSIALAVSAAIHILVSPLTVVWIISHRTTLIEHPRLVALWLALAVLVVPMVFGVGAARFADLLFVPIRRQPERLKWFRRVVAVTVKATPLPSTWD